MKAPSLSCIAAMSLLLSLPCFAQQPEKPETVLADPNSTTYTHEQPAPPPLSEPIVNAEEAPATWNGYEVHYSIEAGGRATNGSGNRAVYASDVGLYDGFRLFDQSLSLHSTGHNGFLFDDLTSSSFGYGGDPNNVTRLRIGKHKWYDFSGNFRRDKNFWDYNLLANPINPTNNPGNIQVLSSPHLLNQSRKMTDLDLSLLPDSKLRFQLGYSRFNNEGSSFTTDHQGTEALMAMPVYDTSDTYRFGVTWMAAPRTRISFDQFFTHVKSDTFSTLKDTPYALSNGTPVTLGISYDLKNNVPCAKPIINSTTNPPTASSTCSSFTSYLNSSPYRTSIPTEQLSFQTSYFHRLDVTGRISYSSAESVSPANAETIREFNSRVRVANSFIAGKGAAQNISPSADLGVDLEITDKLRLDDHFRWYDFRLPSVTNLNTTSLFATSATSPVNTFTPTSCPPPFTASTCPQHSASSGADLIASTLTNFYGQNQKINTIELEYQFTPIISARLGYRFERRDITTGGSTSLASTFFPTLATRGGCAPPLTGGICQTTSFASDSTPLQINDHAALFGAALRTGKGFRLAGDIELHSADNVFTSIMPRHAQQYRVKASYVPTQWLNLTANMRLREARNLSEGLGNRQHDHDFAFTAVLAKWQRFTADFSYGHTDLLRDINICFVENPAPSFAIVNGICGPKYLTALNFYRNTDSFATANIMVKPVQRATVTFGYTVNATDGSALLLNPNLPLGPVVYQYHLPNVTFAYDLTKRLTFKTGWNYYNYNEESAAGPTLPRDFRTHMFTTSLRFTR